MLIEKHAPGSFCWFELATIDQDDAKAFYNNLFGWGINDQPIGPTEMYTLFTLQDRHVAAAYTMRAEQRAQGVPPNWMVYIAVANADEAAAKIAAAGGTVHAPPFDVMDLGRMAVIADPTGAMFAIWEAKLNPGTGVGGVNGTCVWVDLNSPDPARAAKFYNDVFGWKIVGGKDMAPAGPEEYGHIVNGDTMIGGVAPAKQMPSGTPAHWLIYFAVPDCDGALSETVAEHGRVLVKTITMEGHRKFAVLADPQGAAFAVVQEMLER